MDAAPPDESLREQAVRRRLSRRQEDAEREVRLLVEAGLALMSQPGTTPRVADIVRAAGLSNDAFYRFFKSKDDLFAAVVDDGARRLLDYVRHRRDTAAPADRLAACLDAVLSQAGDPAVAASTRAVVRNAARFARTESLGQVDLTARLAALLVDPLAERGAADPPRDARAAAAATLGVMQQFLWTEQLPGPADVEHLIRFVLRGAGGSWGVGSASPRGPDSRPARPGKPGG